MAKPCLGYACTLSRLQLYACSGVIIRFQDSFIPAATSEGSDVYLDGPCRVKLQEFLSLHNEEVNFWPS